ncbi:MAG: hypothetical protein JOY71_01450 [Acetobacteraceae bacterium]|nr:hypothetical protein [Acetobacteraceae bacterium]MBV8520794.1 hypothetical protein [Acetobacteraceae bacterium]
MTSRTLLWLRPLDHFILVAVGYVILLIVSLFVGCGLFYLFFQAVQRIDWVILSFGTSWLLLAMIFGACIALFGMRSCVVTRLGYGLLEILIGVDVVFMTVTAIGANGTPLDPVKREETVIKIAAGMYIVIRGLDNLIQGYRHYWKWWTGPIR